MFTGYRLSLGLFVLVIVAIEIAFSGRPASADFVAEYSSLIYPTSSCASSRLAVVGFVLDRLMSRRRG